MGLMRETYHAMKQKPLPEISIAELATLLAKTSREGGCWVWSGRTRGEYARVGFGGTSYTVTRLVRNAVFGDVTSGEVVDHLCRNTLCVNPLHLESVTQAENIRRAPTAIANINREKTRCKNGHLLGLNNLVNRADKYRECLACKNISQRNYYRRKQYAI